MPPLAGARRHLCLSQNYISPLYRPLLSEAGTVQIVIGLLQSLREPGQGELGDLTAGLLCNLFGRVFGMLLPGGLPVTWM